MSKNTLDSTGKVALVTGASSGMGLATAKAFAEAGAAVVLADIREDLVRVEADKLSAAGQKAIAVRCDVSDDGEVAAMVDRAVSEFGRLDAACASTCHTALMAGRPRRNTYLWILPVALFGSPSTNVKRCGTLKCATQRVRDRRCIIEGLPTHDAG